MGQRVLLLVDDEENILHSLVRLLRRDGYTVLTANGGQQGLELLAQHPVGVILSDQRMPGMMGSEFLERAKDMRPETVRIMLSGYTDLQSVTDAINRGAIYKFLTKPWDDELLRENIRQAFEHHELRAERDQLQQDLQTANTRLAESNQGLEQRLASQRRELDQHHRLLELSREVLEHLPIGVLGIGDDGIVALANSKVGEMIGCPAGHLLGQPAEKVLPPALHDLCLSMDNTVLNEWHDVRMMPQGKPLKVHGTRLGTLPGCNGNVLVLVPEPDNGASTQEYGDD